MDVFLKFLIFGGKYLSQLTAQSIVEAYRRSVQLGRALTLNAEHAVVVVSHYDNVLELYQKNLEEFEALPHAHLAFISEQHRQEFEAFMHDSGLVSEEDMLVLFKHGTAADGEVASIGLTYAQQMTQSILGSCGPSKATPRTDCTDSVSEDIPFEDPVDVDYTNQENVKSYNCLSPRPVHAFSIFKETEPDGALNSVAEYLDRQAEYIKCANDTFKELQVDIANKYAQMQAQAVKQHEEDLEREKAFAHKLKTVQQEVENCTKLMKKAQNHFDIDDEDHKTKRLFGSIDKIIEDVESITQLMKVNEEHFEKCENLKLMQEKGSTDVDSLQVMDANLQAYNKFVCQNLGQQVKQYTRNTLPMLPAVSTSGLTPIEDNIMKFLSRNKHTDTEREKIMEINQKEFEKAEKTLKYPLIGRWNNHLKKCRKTTNLTREKDRKARRKRNNLSIKKSYKGSKSWMSRSRFLGTFPYKSADDMRVSNFAALSTTWINDEPDAGPMYNINNAITRFINRQSKPNVSHIEKHRTVDESLMVVDEKLDYLVEKLLDNIDGNVESSKMPENAQGNKFVGLYSANATDELKMKAFSEIKKEIVSNLQCLRDMQVSEKVDPIAHDIGPIRDYSNMGAQIQQAVDVDYLKSESESPVLFDGIPVELPSDDFDTAMDEFTAQVARNNSMQKRSHQATESEIRELEAVRQMVSEEAVKHQAALEDVRVDAGLEAQRIEAKRALQAAKVARKEAAFDASKVAYQKALDAERVNDNTVRIDITQDTNVSSTFQPRVVHTVSDDICDICADINFDPVQIEIEAPSQVRLHISLSPDVDQSATVDLIETVAPHHREHNEINAKALMKDILTEMNEKEAVYDWQTNNKLLQLAREMNHAAAIKNRHCKEQQAAGKQLHEIMNIDNVETVIESTPSAKQSLAELKNHESNDPANLNLTMNTLKWVNELIHRNNDNPMLGTDGTSVKNVSVFKKSHAETKKRWNKWKNLQPKYRKVKKSYTVVKTRNSEITLQDMINGGSRILNSSVEKLPGTRHISFKKSSENVVKRLKPSTACTTLRKQSSDIKLIPMNLLRPNIQQQSANDDDLIDNKLRLTEKMKSCNLNQYRVESAKAFKPVKFEETPKEEVKIQEPSTSTKKPMYTVHLEKVTEGSSIKSVSDNQAIQFFKQPKKNSLFLDKIPEVPEDKGRDLKITLVQTSVKPEKSEKIANTEEVTENGTTKINEVNSFNAMSKIKAIRKTYEKSMRRSLRTAVLAPDVSRKDAYTSLNQNLAQKLMPKDPKSKNSHNASIDAVNQQTEAGSAVKAQAQEIPPAPPPTPRSPRKTQSFFPAKAVKTEAPVISLKRFQSQTEQLCAPSTEQLRESAKKKRLEKLHNLAIKPPKPVETLSRPSKSEDSIRTKDTISMDSYNPESQTRLVQITPTYILEEPIGKKKKVYEPSTNPYETDKDITVNIRIPEQGSMEDVCDYDVTYKHEVADVSMANPSNQKHIDPLIKRAVETYHMANNEESFKRSQIGSKFLIDYDKSVAKSESFGMRGPQNATDSIADDVSISINIEECDQRPECVSDADLGHRNRYMKHLQRRNQSSVSESRLTPPHSSYAKMRPRLDQLPDLEVIAEQIASENNSRKEQAAADLRAKSEENSETDKSYLNVKGIISPRDMMEPSCAAVKTPPQPVESDQRPQKYNYSKDEFKTQDMDDYAPMAGADMNSIDEDPTGKVELLNPHTHERVLYNFSTDDSHASLSHAENYQKINENNVHAIQERIDKDDKRIELSFTDATLANAA
ncbi:uncharacterized protein [Atheta coriaria]|uniref:uncharacterized protein isoform X2 n=1 Tax=Dalotia coriaria TaxID=877792 RepID=UPI0031F414B3